VAADLLTKLQLKPGQRLAVLSAPAGLLDGLAPQLAALTLTAGEPGATDAVLCFLTLLADVPARLDEAAALLRPGGLLWLAYPKGGPKVGTDLNRDRLAQAVMDGSTWRPVRQIALDELWSALRFRPADEVGR
jgi:hypothetical protein